MEGPHDPQHPGQDAGAPQPEAQDGDLHALLERLLGQGDVRPSAPGAADDLWPEVFAAAPVADEVSTIVPAPDAPADVAEVPTVVEEPAVEAGLEAGAARESPWYQAGMVAFSWSCSEETISPGKTVVTDTPLPASSWRRASAKARWAALVAP